MPFFPTHDSHDTFDHKFSAFRKVQLKSYVPALEVVTTIKDLVFHSFWGGKFSYDS